jgi:hypothetical protein
VIFILQTVLNLTFNKTQVFNFQLFVFQWKVKHQAVCSISHRFFAAEFQLCSHTKNQNSLFYFLGILSNCCSAVARLLPGDDHPEALRAKVKWQGSLFSRACKNELLTFSRLEAYPIVVSRLGFRATA